MSNEKRVMVLTLTFASCSREQADAILALVTTLCGASADLTNAPVLITACPPHAPKAVRDAATRTMQPKSRQCLCPGCVAQAADDASGRNPMVPLDVPICSDGPDYRGVVEALGTLDDAIPSTEPSRGVPSPTIPVVNVRREPRGPRS